MDQQFSPDARENCSMTLKLNAALLLQCFWLHVNVQRLYVYVLLLTCLINTRLLRFHLFLIWKNLSTCSKVAISLACIDLQGKWPTTLKGYKYTCTVICGFSKFLLIIPLKSKKAGYIAKKLWKRVF